MSIGNPTFNEVEFTREMEDCIIHFLLQAESCGYPSANEPYYPIINKIMMKYYETDPSL